MNKTFFVILLWVNIICAVLNFLFLFTGIAPFVNFFGFVMGTFGAVSTYYLIKDIENE